MELKLCTGCKKELPIDAFGKNKNSLDGKRQRCRVCTNEAKKDYITKKVEIQHEQILTHNFPNFGHPQWLFMFEFLLKEHVDKILDTKLYKNIVFLSGDGGYNKFIKNSNNKQTHSYLSGL